MNCGLYLWNITEEKRNITEEKRYWIEIVSSSYYSSAHSFSEFNKKVTVGCMGIILNKIRYSGSHHTDWWKYCFIGIPNHLYYPSWLVNSFFRPVLLDTCLSWGLYLPADLAEWNLLGCIWSPSLQIIKE